MEFAKWIITVTPPELFPEKGQVGAKAPVHPDFILPVKRVWAGGLYPLSPTPTTDKPGFS